MGSREVRDETIKRRHLVTRQDCYNLSRKFNLSMRRRHDNDATSVDIYVQELGREAYNPVLLYKQQNTDVQDYPTIQTSTFLLAIQTKFQQELYKAFSSTILCLDSTHGTNEYGFKLITLLVADDYHNGVYNNVLLVIVIIINANRSSCRLDDL